MIDKIARNNWGAMLTTPNIWSLMAVCIAGLVVAPLVAVLVLAAAPSDNIWPHLWATVLPRYLQNTALLMGAVGALTVAIGGGAAWLTTMYRFPGVRVLEWALLTPLAIPAYVGAYALVDFLEYAGPVQTLLRAQMGWANAQDYWFPEIRSRWAAVLVLSAALYPYVYLLARAAFREHSACSYEVARALGSGPFALFWRVGMPLIRPALAAGAAIVMMETVNDFGVVDFFAVQTLTTGIFSVWLESYNVGGAAQISVVLLCFVLLLVMLEKLGRRGSKFYRLSRHARPITRIPLRGLAAWVATALCLLPVLLGTVLPVGVLISHAVEPALWALPGLRAALVNTLHVGGLAALVTVAGALLIVYGARLSGGALPRLLLPVTTLGYAAPGAVLAVGVLIPMAWLDHRLADGIEAMLGIDPGLLLTGTAFAMVFAFAVRFFAIAVGATDAALGRISPSLPMAARSLGEGPGGTLRRVIFPLSKGSVGTAMLLVFVDSVKELPATLLLRPFNFNTLATQVYDQASLENLAGAAPASLIIVAVGGVAIALLIRTQRRAGVLGTN
jgi:iron(III) transport system permease protein